MEEVNQSIEQQQMKLSNDNQLLQQSQNNSNSHNIHQDKNFYEENQSNNQHSYDPQYNNLYEKVMIQQDKQLLNKKPSSLKTSPVKIKSSLFKSQDSQDNSKIKPQQQNFSNENSNEKNSKKRQRPELDNEFEESKSQELNAQIKKRQKLNDIGQDKQLPVDDKNQQQIGQSQLARSRSFLTRSDNQRLNNQKDSSLDPIKGNEDKSDQNKQKKQQQKPRKPKNQKQQQNNEENEIQNQQKEDVEVKKRQRKPKQDQNNQGKPRGRKQKANVNHQDDQKQSPVNDSFDDQEMPQTEVSVKKQKRQNGKKKQKSQIEQDDVNEMHNEIVKQYLPKNLNQDYEIMKSLRKDLAKRENHNRDESPMSIENQLEDENSDDSSNNIVNTKANPNHQREIKLPIEIAIEGLRESSSQSEPTVEFTHPQNQTFKQTQVNNKNLQQQQKMTQNIRKIDKHNQDLQIQRNIMNVVGQEDCEMADQSQNDSQNIQDVMRQNDLKLMQHHDLNESQQQQNYQNHNYHQEDNSEMLNNDDQVYIEIDVNQDAYKLTKLEKTNSYKDITPTLLYSFNNKEEAVNEIKQKILYGDNLQSQIEKVLQSGDSWKYVMAFQDDHNDPRRDIYIQNLIIFLTNDVSQEPTFNEFKYSRWRFIKKITSGKVSIYLQLDERPTQNKMKVYYKEQTPNFERQNLVDNYFAIKRSLLVFRQMKNQTICTRKKKDQMKNIHTIFNDPQTKEMCVDYLKYKYGDLQVDDIQRIIDYLSPDFYKRFEDQLQNISNHQQQEYNAIFDFVKTSLVYHTMTSKLFVIFNTDLVKGLLNLLQNYYCLQQEKQHYIESLRYLGSMISNLQITKTVNEVSMTCHTLYKEIKPANRNQAIDDHTFESTFKQDTRFIKLKICNNQTYLIVAHQDRIHPELFKDFINVLMKVQTLKTFTDLYNQCIQDRQQASMQDRMNRCKQMHNALLDIINAKDYVGNMDFLLKQNNDEQIKLQQWQEGNYYLYRDSFFVKREFAIISREKSLEHHNNFTLRFNQSLTRKGFTKDFIDSVVATVYALKDDIAEIVYQPAMNQLLKPNQRYISGDVETKSKNLQLTKELMSHLDKDFTRYVKFEDENKSGITLVYHVDQRKFQTFYDTNNNQSHKLRDQVIIFFKPDKTTYNNYKRTPVFNRYMEQQLLANSGVECYLYNIKKEYEKGQLIKISGQNHPVAGIQVEERKSKKNKKSQDQAHQVQEHDNINDDEDFEYNSDEEMKIENSFSQNSQSQARPSSRSSQFSSPNNYLRQSSKANQYGQRASSRIQDYQEEEEHRRESVQELLDSPKVDDLVLKKTVELLQEQYHKLNIRGNSFVNSDVLYIDRFQKKILDFLQKNNLMTSSSSRKSSRISKKDEIALMDTSNIFEFYKSLFIITNGDDDTFYIYKDCEKRYLVLNVSTQTERIMFPKIEIILNKYALHRLTQQSIKTLLQFISFLNEKAKLEIFQEYCKQKQLIDQLVQETQNTFNPPAPSIAHIQISNKILQHHEGKDPEILQINLDLSIAKHVDALKILFLHMSEANQRQLQKAEKEHIDLFLGRQDECKYLKTNKNQPLIHNLTLNNKSTQMKEQEIQQESLLKEIERLKSSCPIPVQKNENVQQQLPGINQQQLQQNLPSSSNNQVQAIQNSSRILINNQQQQFSVPFPNLHRAQQLRINQANPSNMQIQHQQRPPHQIQQQQIAQQNTISNHQHAPQ